MSTTGAPSTVLVTPAAAEIVSPFAWLVTVTLSPSLMIVWAKACPVRPETLISVNSEADVISFDARRDRPALFSIIDIMNLLCTNQSNVV